MHSCQCVIHLRHFRWSFCFLCIANINLVVTDLICLVTAHMCYSFKYVRLCLPFPCVSTPLYGPSCFLSLVHSSPSVFDLLLTWCCFPWLLCVHKPKFISYVFWVFPESLFVNSSMWLCILCSVIKFPLFLLPLVSRVRVDRDRLTDLKG